MPTNDQNVTLNPAQPQTDILSSDVDLDVSKNEVNDQASGFDFSLDLPDNFVTQPVQTPVEEPVNLNFDLNSETIQQQASPVQMDFLAENAVLDSEVRSSLFTQDAQEENIPEVSVEAQQVVAPLEDSFPMPQETAPLAEAGSVENFEFKSETSTFLHQDEEEKKVENQTFAPVFSQEAPVSFVADVSNASVANDAGSVESTPEVEMDPFEAMRATINAGAEFPVSESQSVTASSEEETISAPVENISLQDDVGESNLNTFTTPIVEPVPPQDSALDPMDTQLPAQSEASLSSTTPQMLSLDEMIAQPQPTTPSTQTINLDVMANVAANAPIDSAVPMAPAGIPVSTGNTKAILAIVASGIVVLMLAFVAFLRYPSEIASLFGMPNANPVVQPSEVETSLDQEDHGAAELTGETLSGDVIAEEEVFSGDVEIMVDETQLSTDEQVQEIVLEGADEEQVLPADDSESENSSNVDLSVQSDSTSEEVLLPHEENPVDALGAVEDLVGGVGPNDVLLQEVESYKLKAEKLVEQGRAQEDPELGRLIIRNAGRTLKEVRKLQEELANGKKMSISEWNSLKAELDISLNKAQNGTN